MKKKLTRPVLLVEGGAQDANVRYASGFSAPDSVVLLVHGRHRYLVVSLLEYGRARSTADVTEVYTPKQLGLEGPAAGQPEAWAHALLVRKGIRSVSVGGTFPLGVADTLREFGISVQVSPGPLFPRRRKKTEQEVRYIAAVQRAAVRAMKTAIRAIHESGVDPKGYLVREGRRVRSEDIRRIIDASLLAHDCVAPDTIVAGGVQGADPHERGHGPLRAAQPIVIDIFPRHTVTGYWGDITRTVFKGSPHPEQIRMYKAVAAAQKAAIGEVRAGITVKRVHQTAQRVLSAHGFETTVKNGWGEGFIHSTGHGVGLDIHEGPSINLSSTRLRIGDVITIEPGLYYKQWGGVRIEDTVEVTAVGARLLAHCPYRDIV